MEGLAQGRELRDQATTNEVRDRLARGSAVVRILAPGMKGTIGRHRILGHIDAPASTRALLRLAVFSASGAVRSAATEALVRREARDFGGWLVENIRTPWKYQAQPVDGPGSPGALQIVTPHFTMLRTYDAPSVFALSDQFFGYVGYDVNGLPVVVRGAEMNSCELTRSTPGLPTASSSRSRPHPDAYGGGQSQSRRLAAALDRRRQRHQGGQCGGPGLNQRITPILKASLDAPNLKATRTHGKPGGTPPRLPLRPGAAGHARLQRISAVWTAANL